MDSEEEVTTKFLMSTRAVVVPIVMNGYPAYLAQMKGRKQPPII